MQGYRKIHAAKVRAARRRIRRKRERWRTVIVRGSGKGSNPQLRSPQRRHANVSRMRKHG